MLIPTLNSARLRMRGHKLEDFESSASMWANPLVTLHIGGKPSTTSESWTRFLKIAGLWATMGFGYWLVEELGTNRFVGEVGFAEHYREMEPSIRGIPEAGWVLSPEISGKGYATEAVKMALKWADENLTKKQTACIIKPDNLASIRVAEKCGYKETCRTTYENKPTIVFIR